MRTFGFIVGILLSCPTIWGQQDKQIFRHLSLNQGMPDVSVFDIMKGPGGFMWFATKNGLVKYDGVEFVTYLHHPEDSTSLPESSIRSLYCDKRGNLWIGTRKGLSRYCPIKDQFERMDLPGFMEEDLYVRDMTDDATGRLWLATSRGILIYDPQSSTAPMMFGEQDGLHHKLVNTLFTSRSGVIWIGTATGLDRATLTPGGIKITRCQLGENHNGHEPYWIQAIQEDPSGKLWLGTRKHGLLRVSSQGTLLPDDAPTAMLKQRLARHEIRDICFRKDGGMWVAAYGGLTFYDEKSGHSTTFQHEDFVPTSLSNNALKCLFLDESETLWIGTYYGGVNVLSKGYNLFPHFEHETSANSLSYNVVSSFEEDHLGNVWIGTEGGGLNCWDRRSGEFQAFQFEEVFTSQSNNIKALAIDTDHTLWVGTFQKGLYSFDLQTKAFKAHPFLPLAKGADEEQLQSVYALLAEEDTVWVGTFGQGLWYMDLQTGKVPQRIPINTSAFDSDNVRVILKDHAHRIWIGTGFGLFQLHRKKEFILEQILDYAEVFSMDEDPEGRLWIGTFEHGLIRYEPDTKTTRQFTVKQGLPNQSIYGVLSDTEGGIWISSPNGIAGKRAADSTFQTYSIGEELPNSAYNLHAYKQLRDGKLLFGGIQGFTMFDPMEVNGYAMNDSVPLVLTGLTVRNHKIHVGDETGILNQTLNRMETLEFAYNEASFTIDFTLLNFVNPGKHQYAYKLDGLDNHWNLVSGKGRATYTIQNPGTYILWIRGSTGQGSSMEHERSIKIVVNPPIWKSIWAYLGYFLISMLLLLGTYQVLRERIRLRQRLFKDQLEIQKQEELSRTRQTFFTNVTHEFRTPLTLILGILEELILGKPDPATLVPKLKSIRKQSRRLLNLVTELMTLSKLESHYHQLEVESVNLVSAVSETFDSFRHRAATQEINYQLHRPESEIPVSLDPDKFDKILFNLLSNAFKFTPQGGQIEVRVIATSSSAKVVVKDSGLGIKPEDLPKIFDRYYSTSRFESEGTGIGLSLTKQLVDMHKWKIETLSDLGKGTQFTITMPLGAAHFVDDTLSELSVPTFLPTAGPVPDKPLSEASQRRATVLVVEDHPEVRAFLASILEPTYEVLQASDGKMGLEFAKTHRPDLILSDVMMPQVNGLDMCTQLKATPETSAIPVLLLSARHELEARVEGLQAGANDYLSKPFSPQELRLKIQNFLQSGQQLRDQSVRIINLEPKELLLPKQDEIFLEQLIEAIEVHMWDPDYGVNQLSIDVGVSRPVLFKKIKSLTDQTPKKFINLFRLRRAAQLLKDGDRSVSEIAYSVGFNDAKYFTRIFKEVYGVVPVEYGKVTEKG